MRLGFYIEYGKGHYFLIKMRDDYKGEICGLCGDWNGSPDNDWTIGNRCNQESEPGTIVNILYYSIKFDNFVVRVL